MLEDETLPVAVAALVRFADEVGRGQDARTTGGAGILPAAFSTPPALHPATGILPAAAPTKLPPTLSNQPPARAALPPPLAPQVTITIGRVEIRAAALPVQPITPVVSGPPLSLETYLRRSASRTA